MFHLNAVVSNVACNFSGHLSASVIVVTSLLFTAGSSNYTGPRDEVHSAQPPPETRRCLSDAILPPSLRRNLGSLRHIKVSLHLIDEMYLIPE